MFSVPVSFKKEVPDDEKEAALHPSDDRDGAGVAARADAGGPGFLPAGGQRDHIYLAVLHICEHSDSFIDGIQPITRKASYKTESHLGQYNPNSRRTEEITAMKMFNFCKEGGRYDSIGKIIDYQTPLKNVSSDEAGKIDLLAYDGACLRLLELKKPVTKETMLRCLMEGFTYLETVDQKKLLQNFDLPPDTKIVACPLVFVGEQSNPYQEMQEERPQLRRLMDLLNSKPYYIRQTNDTFTVTEG